MKKIMAVLLMAVLLTTPCLAIEPLPEESFDLKCTSAVLMERESGALLYAKNAHQHLSPASVTKVMTMLLIAEAVDSGARALTDVVTTSATAAGMGGSQVYLEEGERFTLEEMLKCVAVVSANDCAVALAERLCGSERAFAERMNRRAEELGLTDTHFSNCTGLSSEGEHYTSAWDMAVMSRELLKHTWVRQYTTLRTDSIRDGEFVLHNTNKLLRNYDGCTGLKTGFTNEAMFCLSASAEREGVEYIAVVLHGESSATRFDACRTLLDYAFANYASVSLLPKEPLPPVKVEMGVAESVQPVAQGSSSMVVDRGTMAALSWEVELPAKVSAPVEAGQVLGQVRVRSGQEQVAVLTLVAEQAVERQSYWYVLRGLLGELFGGG